MRRLLPLIVLSCALPVVSPARAQKSGPEKSGPEKWEPAIKKFEEQDAKSMPPQGGVVFVGSSSIALWPYMKQAFPGHTVIKRGFGGSKVADSTYFADRIVIKYRPRTVVMYAGENDLAARMTPEQVLEDFRAFVKKVHAALPKTRIIYISIKPNPRRIALVETFKKANALIAAECGKDPQLTFFDIVPEMVDSEGKPRAELFLDGLHLNRKGYKIWEEKLRPLLDR